jgi:CPA1 family monovalent cation:H+ antiporter
VGLFEIIAVLITLAALFSYVNHRVLRLPTTIGLMVMALALSLALVLAGLRYPGLEAWAEQLLRSIDFDETLLHGMLGYLLFAGALHVDLGDLRRHGVLIGTLASVGVVLSTFLVGAATWGIAQLLNLHVEFVHCLLFGALISPTDPIAVLSILKSLGAPHDLEVQMSGESLFNDGVGVVVFLALLGFAGAGHGGHAPDAASIARLFAQEVLGGAALGFGLGWLAYRMLKSMDNYSVEILVSLALVTGGYALADAWHLSGPIAMVVAGLLIGNHGRAFAMSERTREHLDVFWELVDEILNAVLFVLIGLEVLLLTLRGNTVLAGVMAIPVVLLARAIAVGLPLAALRRAVSTSRHSVALLTWGGLRGGISVALALSLRDAFSDQTRTADTIVMMTYVVVVFSIVVQGLTVAPLFRRLLPQARSPFDATQGPA